MNEDWIRFAIEEDVEVRYVIGGADTVVTRESACPYIGNDKVDTLIGSSHSDIIAPTGTEDIRFTVLRKFVAAAERSSPANIPERAPDPVFDVYSLQDEPFYVHRPVDAFLRSAMSSGHVW